MPLLQPPVAADFSTEATRLHPKRLKLALKMWSGGRNPARVVNSVDKVVK